jgi:hypothetical protein
MDEFLFNFIKTESTTSGKLETSKLSENEWISVFIGIGIFQPLNIGEYIT